MICTKSSNILQTIRPYPKLMVNSNGAVVLFRASGEGTTVFAKPDSYNIVGHYDSSRSMEKFADFVGSINISEEE